ncbi:SEC-C metal-binding domain-containing protein [Clostridium sp.]|uniref:SEC-C metal-binding domain-containing protein n=1 Tax=Clostridium sp. TaxID=1506 RepID=UPI002FDE5EA1
MRFINWLFKNKFKKSKPDIEVYGSEMDEEEKELELIQTTISDWINEFKSTEHFNKMNDLEKENSEFVVEVFSDYMYEYEGLKPLEWDEVGLIDCCLNILPQKVSADADKFKCVSPVLESFFNFLDENKYVLNGKKLSKSVKQISRQIVKNAVDPNRWGMAKRFVMGAKNRGIDITDEKEMNQYMLDYNNNKPIVNEPKIGRNELCPCGSGKKYKKCCGNK